MQNLIGGFDVYCSTWELTVNCNKTKGLIFGGSKKMLKSTNILTLFFRSQIGSFS